MLQVANLDDHEEIAPNQEMQAQEKDYTPVQDTAELRNEIVETAQLIIDLQQERKLINAQIQEQYEKLETRGIVKTAFKTGIKDLTFDQVQRDKHDRGLSIVRKACGIPVQADMFE